MKKVLICDDSMFMRSMLKRILVGHGIEVVGEAADGRQAIDMFRELQPDLVTMDITMPEINGIEAVKIIMEEQPDAKVIMVSAMGQRTLVTEAIKAGAQDFIIKPFNPDQVLNAIEKVLAR